MKAVHTIDHVVNTILRWIVMIMLSVMSVIVFAQVVFNCTFIYSMERGTFKISSDLEYIYGCSSVRSQRLPCWS